MKSILIIFSTLFCVFFVVSSATAIPHFQSNFVLDEINKIEEIETKLQNKIIEINDLITDKIKDFLTLGIIDKLINLLTKLLELILNIASFISTILNIVGQILYLLNQINYILENIMIIINWIIDFFNPENILLNN